MRYYVGGGRGFDEGIPVHLWTRFAFRSDLAKHPAFKGLAVALIVRYARRCGVELHAVAALDNHFHLIASQRGKIRWEDRWKRGISPFMRNWKSELSYQLRALGLSGSKFEARFDSVNLTSWEQYVTKYAYVVGQAVRHGARDDEVVISRAILDGSVDGIADVIPALYGDRGAEAAAQFGALIREVIHNVQRLARGEELEVRAGLRDRRRRRQELERRRDESERSSRCRQRLREMVPQDWWEAAQVAMWNDGVDVSARPLAWFPAATLAPGLWFSALVRWTKYRMPVLAVTHERDADGRVVQSRVSGGGHLVRIRWPLRLDDPPP